MRIAIALATTLWAVSALQAADPAKPADKPAEKLAEKPTVSQEDLEKKFAEQLSGATLVGHFTLDGKAGSPKEERYVLSKVAKIEGETWLFMARIVYGEHDVTVPLPLTVKWAGDTPVITLTDALVPGLGTYTARVLIYRGQYAGTWSGGDHGGQLFGRIEKPKVDANSEPKPDAKPAAGK